MWLGRSEQNNSDHTTNILIKLVLKIRIIQLKIPSKTWKSTHSVIELDSPLGEGVEIEAVDGRAHNEGTEHGDDDSNDSDDDTGLDHIGNGDLTGGEDDKVWRSTDGHQVSTGASNGGGEEEEERILLTTESIE